MKNEFVGTPEEMYSILKPYLHETVKEKPNIRKRDGNYRTNEELEDLVKQKKEIYNKWLTTRDPEDVQT